MIETIGLYSYFVHNLMVKKYFEWLSLLWRGTPVDPCTFSTILHVMLCDKSCGIFVSEKEREGNAQRECKAYKPCICEIYVSLHNQTENNNLEASSFCCNRRR